MMLAKERSTTLAAGGDNKTDAKSTLGVEILLMMTV